ncbi:hypothetical protein KDM41_05020 [bacterium]|nr:hypothetical protein [bacterium]
MRKWLHDNPWIWIVLFLATLVAGSMVTLVIAQLNRPEIVKEKPKTHSLLMNDDAQPAGLRVA